MGENIKLLATPDHFRKTLFMWQTLPILSRWCTGQRWYNFRDRYDLDKSAISIDHIRTHCAEHDIKLGDEFKGIHIEFADMIIAREYSEVPQGWIDVYEYLDMLIEEQMYDWGNEDHQILCDKCKEHKPLHEFVEDGKTVRICIWCMDDVYD